MFWMVLVTMVVLVDRTVSVRTLWPACSKMPTKGNPAVEPSRKPYRHASSGAGYRESQASQNGSYWWIVCHKGRARDPRSRGTGRHVLP